MGHQCNVMHLIHFYGSSDLQYLFTLRRKDDRQDNLRLFALKHRLEICVTKRGAGIFD